MLPFKLEVIRHGPNDNRAPKMLYCKRDYNKKVKVDGWNMNLEYEPIDTNPYHPKCYRLHSSHYERLGNQDPINFKSETHDSLERGVIKTPEFERNPHKSLINYYTFSVDSCKQTKRQCPKICPDYVTTMQKSYQAPYPCVFKELAMPSKASQNNKHMASKEDCKFLDDNFADFTRVLQKVKGWRHVSFDPCTGTFMDRS